MPIQPPPLPAPSLPSNTRTANDLMIEISGHLVEDVVNAQLTSPATQSTGMPPTPSLLQVSSTLAMYAGAEVVIAQPDGSLPAIITLVSVDPSTLTATAVLLTAYSAGATLLAGTFPTQQPSDPLFTQSEILEYLARAQNEFLSRVPCIFQFTSQQVDLGVELQALPASAIELERVAINGTRLYETSQTQLTMQNPQWQYASGQPTPTAWFEDRAGYYGWGLAPPPQAAFECALITSQRGPDTLNLLSLLTAPDPFAHIIKYKAMEYVMSKAGEERSPTMMRIYRSHFESGVAIATRYMDGVVNAPGKRG